jgi:hypothetical protein
MIGGDPKMIEAMNTIFSCFMTICLRRLEKEDFYVRLGKPSDEQWEYYSSIKPSV